jgi:predicted DNA-binding transcriptional regulator YafY
MATLPRAVKTEVFLHTDIAAAKRECPETLGVPEACDGGVLLKGSADELDWYARELMRLPFPFDIRAPQPLRTMVRRLAAEIAERFAA